MCRVNGSGLRECSLSLREKLLRLLQIARQPLVYVAREQSVFSQMIRLGLVQVQPHCRFIPTLVSLSEGVPQASGQYLKLTRDPCSKFSFAGGSLDSWIG